MSPTTAGIIFIAAMAVALAAVHKPLGDYMYRVVSRQHHRRVERAVHRAIGVKSDVEQT